MRSATTRSCPSARRSTRRCATAGGCSPSWASRCSARSTTSSTSTAPATTSSGVDVTGRWNHRVDGVNPWTRFRLGRLVNYTLILIVLTAFVAWRSETPFFETLVNLPSTVVDYMFDPIGELPFIFTIALQLVLTVGVFGALFWFMGKGGRRDLLPRRRLGALRRRVGPRRRAREDEGEPRLRRGPGVDRATGRPRARWRPALRASGHRQDAHGRGGGGRDRQAVRVRRARRLPQHVLRRRRAQGALAVQEAEEVGAALRRRHRLLRRSRRARQPRRSVGRHRIAVTPISPHLCNGINYMSDATKSSLLFDEQAEESDSGRGGIFRFFMPGMRGGGGGDISALQALLAEMSGLTKPRGFINRYVRRLLGMQPKPPPKYRIFFIMASNMPDSLDAGAVAAGPPRPQVQGRLSVEGRPQAHVRGISQAGEAPAHRRRPRAALDHLAVRDRRIDQEHGERSVDPRHRRRPRHDHVARHAGGEARRAARAPRRLGVHPGRASRRRDPRGVPRGRLLPVEHENDDRRRHDRASR